MRSNAGLPGLLNGIRKQPFLPVLIVFVTSASLLCWRLGARYLWQDEADTAVLAERMMSYGRPLAYDGRNFISRDFFSPEDAYTLPTGDPAEAVRYAVRRGDFKADTAWIGQPWGQFIVAGVSLALFGHDTVPARLPFVLAGALTTAFLYTIARRRSSSEVAAAAAVALVLTNSFWVMHMRQCRYYALSSLFLLVTLEAYLGWRDGRRWGGAIFALAAWVWFQTDYGSVWPVLGILGLHALISQPGRLRESVVVLAGLFAAIAPFCLYYELAGRVEHTATNWAFSISTLLGELNQFQLPLIMVPVVLCLLWLKRRDSNTASRTLAGLSLSVICADTVWMSFAAPYPYYRYIVPLTTLSAIVAAYGMLELTRLLPRSNSIRWLVPIAVTAATLLLVITNLASLPGAYVLPEKYRLEHYLSSIVRPEIELLFADLAGDEEDDPNRATVEFLRQRVEPGDEILCNYEDKPLMFYLRNLIRGGTSCFRVTDAGEARFAVYRRSVAETHTFIYLRELGASKWLTHVLSAPDILCGNLPDPLFHHLLLSPGSRPLVVLERVSP